MTHEKSVFENEPDNTAFGCFHNLSPEKRRELQRLMRRIIDDDNEDEALLGSKKFGSC